MLSRVSAGEVESRDSHTNDILLLAFDHDF
jgi:hypothetical protein